jgi:hypothetical protein
MLMDVYSQIVLKIIQRQESIIGPIAVEQAEQVSGLKLDWTAQQVSISGDEAKVVDQLVDKYQDLFGQLSVEVCKEAAASLLSQLPSGGLPETLK